MNENTKNQIKWNELRSNAIKLKSPSRLIDLNDKLDMPSHFLRLSYFILHISYFILHNRQTNLQSQSQHHPHACMPAYLYSLLLFFLFFFFFFFLPFLLFLVFFLIIFLLVLPFLTFFFFLLFLLFSSSPPSSSSSSPVTVPVTATATGNMNSS